MTYASGSPIQASDLAGSWYPTLSAIYGIGNGNTGYGQSAITLTSPAQGSPVTAAQWANLRNVLSVLRNHQVNNNTGLMAAPTAGSTIAVDGNLSSLVTAANTDRLAAGAGSMTLTSGAHTVTRTSSWAATITAVVDVNFGSEDAARFFFNSGGHIRMALTHPPGVAQPTTQQDGAWHDLCNRVGTLTIGSSSFSSTGTAASMVGTGGFYGLTTTDTQIYAALNAGAGQYSANDVIFNASVRNRAGTNGGNGNTIRVTVTLADQHANAFYDAVASGTVLTFSHYRATTYLTGIVSPTYTTVTIF